MVDPSINTDPSSPGNGGFALYLDDSSVMYENAEFIYGNELTIEFLIKCTNCTGVIMSYTVVDTFSLFYDDTLMVGHGSSVQDTQRTLEDGEWNMISLVFEDDTLSVFVFDSAGVPLFSQLTVAPLESYGDLVFGTWMPPKDSSHFRPDVGDFVGLLDDIRIWRTTFDSVLIQSHWNSLFDASVDVGTLAALWKMDTSGFEYKDEIAAYEFVKPIVPFNQPAVVISTAPIPAATSSLSLPFDPQTYMTSAGTRRRRAPPANTDDATRAVTAEQVTQFCEQIFLIGPMAE